MKKSKRTLLLLAGTAALSATLLVPTVLSACSTTPNTDNPGDDTNKPGGDTNNPGDGNDNNGGGTGGDGNTDPETKPDKLADELKKLNDSANASARKNIYTDYFKAINKTASVRLTELTPPVLTKPTVTPLIEITQKGDFFGDLITMINKGLDVGNASQNGQISQSDLTGIITNLHNEKDNMTAEGQIPNASQTDPTPGSIWSPNAFEFSDVSTATWTYVSQNKNTVYQLFLTENVDYKFESTVDKVSVKVSNKVGSDKTRSRLVVTTKKSGTAGAKTTSGETTTPSATYESKTYNFKSNVDFALPSSLFDDFTSYLDAFDANVKKLKDYLPNATKKYKDLISDSTKGFASAATLWNQFVTQSEETLLNTIKSDLNTNRSKSKIFEWIKANVNEVASSSGTTDTTLVGQLQKDLEAAKSVDVDLDTLTITGKTTDNNGINNATGEEPDYTLIISFEAEETTAPQEQKTNVDAEVSLDEKWYVLNLKATEFKFENTVNQEFFGYQDASFVTNPKLKLDAKCEFASYKLVGTGDQIGNNELATVQKLRNASLNNSDQLVDISGIYDINGTGFTKFLSNLVIDRKSSSTDLTDKLINVNTESSANTWTKFKEYLNTNSKNVEQELLQPNVLADLILDNIDVSNLAMKSEKFAHGESTDNFPSNPADITDGTNKGWRQIINNWVKGGTSSSEDAKPEVIIKNSTSAGSQLHSNSRAISSTFENAADIVIKAKTTGDNDIPTYPLLLGNNNRDYRFRSIYIFLGDGSNVDTLVNGSNNKIKTASLSVDLTNTTEPNTNNQTWTNILQNIQDNNKFCILFEKAKFDSTQNKNEPPVYGFYMGQRKVQATSRTGDASTTQSKFSISLDALLGDGTKFLETLLAKK